MLLYHGTRAAFRRGGYLFPQSWHGQAPRAGHVGEDSTEFVYMTTDRELAEWYAVNSPGRNRARVLTVEPLGPIEHDPSRYDDEQYDQYRCRDGAKVVDVYFLPVMGIT